MEKYTPPSWSGIYSEKSIKKYVDEVHDNKIWLSKIKAELSIIKKNQNKLKNFNYYRPCSLALICSIYKNIKKIIDIGGSNGWSYYYLKEYSKNVNIKKYSIFENMQVINYFKNKHDNEKISYISDIKKNCQYDLLYSNSTFQYFLDDSFILKSIKNVDAKYILLDDTFIGDIKDYYSLQNYYNYKIPVKFRNSNQFIQLIKKLGYKLIFMEPYISKHRNKFQPLPMKGFTSKFKVEFSQKLFFIRNDKHKR